MLIEVDLRKWDKRGLKWDGGTRVIKVGLSHLNRDMQLTGIFVACF